VDRVRRAAGIAVIGWLLVALFGLFLIAEEPRSAAIFIAVGLALAAWVRWRPGAPALAVSLVIGLLHTVEQVAYLSVDLSKARLTAGHALLDGEALLGGLLVVAGSVTALVRRRQFRAAAGKSARGRSAVGR
jgi:hypothetical protein